MFGRVLNTPKQYIFIGFCEVVCLLYYGRKMVRISLQFKIKKNSSVTKTFTEIRHCYLKNRVDRKSN